jgi:hypothetical protein
VFFDLIAFFGTASFFAWLAAAPLQDETVSSKYLGDDNVAKARRNLYVITQYFFVSFLFFSISAIGDYLVAHPKGR